MTRKRLVALVLGAALLFLADSVAKANTGLPAITAVAPSTVAAGAAPTGSPLVGYPCKTLNEHFQDWFYIDGFDQYYLGLTFILTKNKPPTNMCAIEAGGVSVQYQIQNTDLCLTYAGSRTGGTTSFLDEVTCSPGSQKASQRWTWWSNDTMTNDYTGTSYCLQDEGNDYTVRVFSCDSDTDQLFNWG